MNEIQTVIVKNGKLQHSDSRFTWPAIDGDVDNFGFKGLGISDPILPDGEYPINGFEKVTQHDDSKNVWIMCPIDTQDAIRQKWPIRPAYYFFRENLKDDDIKTTYLKDCFINPLKTSFKDGFIKTRAVSTEEMEDLMEMPTVDLDKVNHQKPLYFSRDERNFLVNALNVYKDIDSNSIQQSKLLIKKIESHP